MFGTELSELSLPRRCSRNSIPPVSWISTAFFFWGGGEIPCVLLAQEFLGSVFGRTDFSRIFIFGPPDFFADFVAGFFEFFEIFLIFRDFLKALETTTATKQRKILRTSGGDC